MDLCAEGSAHHAAEKCLVAAKQRKGRREHYISGSFSAKDAS